MLRFTLALLPLALGAFATPVTRQDAGPNCGVFGADGFASTAQNFTLAAWNTTGPNTNSTGVPLVIGHAGSIPGASLKQLSTYASFPFDQYQPLSLSDGLVLMDMPAKDQSTRPPAPGSGPYWVITSLNPPTPAHVYCGVDNADSTGFPLLAVYGSTEGFSLCTGSGQGAQTTVVWNVTSSRTGCYPVNLHIVYT